MENQKEYTQQEITAILSKCRKLIKSSDTRQEAIQILDGLDSSKMNSENKVQFLYINGRYHYYMHDEYGDIEALEWSNDYLDDMATSAYEAKVALELPMLYTRAYVKFLLGNLVWDASRKPWLHAKAEKITQRVLTHNSTNSSFNWLKDQLKG